VLTKDLPTYRELQGRKDAPPGSAWGIFGADDLVGTLNLCTPERIARAAALVRRGAVFSLNWELTKPDPPLFAGAGRRPVRHTVDTWPNGADDRYDDFNPQVSSQWDSLIHVRDEVHGQYNIGTSTTKPAASIDHWARRGIVGRFLLVDLEGYRNTGDGPYDPTTREVFTIDDLDRALARQHVTIDPGDILLLHFGWMRRYETMSVADRRRIADAQQFPGLSAAEEMAAWLWDHHVAAAVADAPALEAFPTKDGVFLHRRLLPLLGMAIGELVRLDHLADDCRADGRYAGLFTAAPLNMPGGIASTANALALK
jgi:kynurenine formamidase